MNSNQHTDPSSGHDRHGHALCLVLSLVTSLVLCDRSSAASPEPTTPRSTSVYSSSTTQEHYAKYQQWNALQIMSELQRRHQQFPYVYEEQTMVLMDAQENRSVRQIRRFSRTEADNRASFLLVFDDPEEIRGVALLAVRDAQGRTERGVYLPAFGAQFKEPATNTRNGHFLGTDFSIEDLTSETLDEHRYVRGRDQLKESVEFFVVDAYPENAQVERSSGYGLRRHHIRKDIFMIVRTDFFDRHLRFMKRITHHDLRKVSGESWRANMVVVSDEREKHRTLLKVDRRIYSRDYVPAEMFDRAFLLGNGHLSTRDDRVIGRLPRGPVDSGAKTRKAESK